jgi:hypothetical protein
MRNLQAEEKSVQRLIAAVGLLMLFGIVSLAIGTEMLVLSFWATSPVTFWILQGIWFMCVAFVLGIIVNVSQRK